MWMRRSPRSALISHLYLLSNPLWQPSIARDLVWEAMLLTQGYISITEGSESDAQLICLINPSFSKKNIWSWGADLLPCSYWQIKMGSLCMLHGYASRLHSIKRNLDSYLYGAQSKSPPLPHTHTYLLWHLLSETRVGKRKRFFFFSVEEKRKVNQLRSPDTD